MEFRRTLIPILLTCGGILVFAGGAIQFSSPDNPLAQIAPKQSGLICLGAGAILLASAIANMWSVARALRRQTPPR